MRSLGFAIAKRVLFTTIVGQGYAGWALAVTIATSFVLMVSHIDRTVPTADALRKGSALKVKKLLSSASLPRRKRQTASNFHRGSRRMGMFAQFRTMTLAAIFAALGALAPSTPSRANIVFDFSGKCDFNCLGAASGALTLTGDYVFGADITAATFVSFSYKSVDRSFTIPAASGPSLAGGLNADGSINSAGELLIENTTDLFEFPSATPGQFVAGPVGAAIDFGSQPRFSLVAIPEPGAWALMTVGFAALGMTMRLRRKLAL
jgi:hypothetical protein